MENMIEIFLLAVGASFVQRTTGFGFGIFIMTLLPFLMPSYGEATALSGLLAMTTSAIIAFRMRQFITWKRLIPILTTFVIISAAAICMLTRLHDDILRKILGIVLIITALYFAFFSRRIKLKTTLPYQIGAGSISGIMGGFFGMQGPPAVLYFISSEPDKNHYMAMVQTYFLIGNAMMTIVRDFNKGAFSARESIMHWPNVRRSEVKWIYPYQENADVLFNSAYLVEFAVVRAHAERILMTVPKNCPEYSEVHRLKKFLSYFTPVSDKEVPSTSLLRSFIGGSSL